ncbi:LuxR C-terminal-related transcriptional regulator [Streptomyces sp. NPDC060223]|uniref:helix-turn-helix transcriptional regulator n=1 Tax=unclassified Streptomyces TaxID=2593676 RepID=UPI00363AB050
MGRGAELEAFAGALADRRCRGFMIDGPAGVGKSRLADEFLVRAVGAGFEVARATASAAAGAVPLGAVAHLLPAGLDMSDPAAGFAAVSDALAGPRRRRWVLLIDDLHLLDAASAMLLQQLMATGSILVIGTVRTGEPLTPAVEALRAGDTVRRAELIELDQEQVEALLQAALGGPVGRRTLHQLWTASGGNVLYLRELVHGAMTSGDLVSDGEIWVLREGRLPGTPRLTELIGARLALACPAGRAVLELLALCEPLPLGDAESLAPPDTLVGLEHAGLINIAQDLRRATVTLAHPLYGEVLRAGLPALRRHALLVQQAARVESHGARRRDDPLHIAIWRLAATGTADPALLTQAAVLARHAHDYPRTVALLQALPEDDRTAAVRLMIGEALAQWGKWDQAEAALAEADALLADDQDRLMIVLSRTANLLWGNADVTEALAVNNAALAQVHQPATRRSLRFNEGFLRIAAGQPTQGLPLLDDMEADMGQAPDRTAWLRAAFARSTGLALVGRTREAVACSEHAYATHLRVGAHVLVKHPATQLGPLALALAETGRLADACRMGHRAYSEHTVSSTTGRIWSAVSSGRIEWLAGHPAGARRWYSEAAALARTVDGAIALRPALSGLAACAALLGDTDAAEAALAEYQAAPTLPPRIFSVGEERLGEAWLLASRGHLAPARAMLVAAAGEARETGHVTAEAMLLTDVARLGGPKEAAGRLAELATLCDGALAPARAELAAALAADDPDQLLRAADACESAGADLLAAEAAAAAAAALRRTGRPRAAAAASTRAAAVAVRCEGARTPVLATAEVTAPLTARERQIALLAATGTSSKDIAQALDLSVRTVDNHLHHVYAKLGVIDRRELAKTLGVTPSRVLHQHPEALAVGVRPAAPR